ncbi:MAG: hypothetical protein WD059_00960 [Balneolaceae bacterium]
MKNKIEQELDQKEFEKDLGKDLKLESERLDIQEKLYAGRNKYSIAAIHFFGTLFISYFMLIVLRMAYNMFFGTAFAMLGVSFAWMNPFIHGAIWVGAVVSVYQKRSVLDTILDRI